MRRAGSVNKVSQRPGARPVGESVVNKVFTLPAIITCKMIITIELI
jgi:hypothetical protein